MKYIRLLLISLLILSWGCVSYHPDLTNQVKFKAYPQDNFLYGKANFDVEIPLDIINNSQLFKKGELLFNNKSKIVNFPLKLYWDDEIKFENPKEDQLIVHMPINWVAEPNIMGISAGKIKGSNSIDLISELRVESGKLNWQVKDYLYNWKEKPELKVLGANLNLATSLDSFLKNKNNKQNLIREINNSTEKLFSKNELNDFKLKYLEKLSLRQEGLKLNLDQISINNLHLRNSNMFFKGYFTGTIFWGDFGNAKNIPTADGFPIYLKIPFFQIETELEKILYQKKPGVKIQFSKENGNLNCKVLNYLGDKSELNFILKPVIEDKSIRFYPVEIEAIKLGLAKSSVKNTIKKKIGKSISSISFNLKDALKFQSSGNNYLKYNILNQNYKIEELYLNDSSIGGLILLPSIIYFKNY